MQLLIIIIVVVSLLLALVGISTNYWYQSLSNEFHEGLWIICRREMSSKIQHDFCQKQPFFKSQLLSIIALVLLSVSLIFCIIQRYRTNHRRLAYLTILLLTTTTILLMFSYLLYPRTFNFRQLGYSIYFMVTSSLLTLITTGLVAFNTRKIQSTD